jgi:hypothetical protein
MNDINLTTTTQIAYNIYDAAKAASVSQFQIIEAVKSSKLVARRLATPKGGVYDHALISAKALSDWVESLPNWNDSKPAPVQPRKKK